MATYFVLKHDVKDDVNVEEVLNTLINSGKTEWSAKILIDRMKAKPAYLMVFIVYDDDLSLQIRLAHDSELSLYDYNLVFHVHNFSHMTQDECQTLMNYMPMKYYQPLDQERYNLLWHTLKYLAP
jgi:hypothetical protein